MNIEKFNTFFQKSMHDTIINYGQEINIYKVSATACPFCTWDPINKESTRPNCSTCGGTYYVNTITIKQIKGIVKDFVTGSRLFWDKAQNPYELFPIGDARFTCLLFDILVDKSSPTGATIIDNSQKIVINGIDYKHHSLIRKGLNSLYIGIATLDKI